MNLKSTINILILIPLLQIFSACSSSSDSSSPSSPSSLTVSEEIATCTTQTTYASSVTVTGQAQFFKRGLVLTQSGGNVSHMKLGPPLASALPIKYAEIRILNSAGHIIQCGTTNSSGELKGLNGTAPLQISTEAGNYSIEVLARSNTPVSVPSGKNSFNLSLSVKTDIYANSVYKISQTFNSTGNANISTQLTAYARESESSEILGGAFNIYNNITSVYDYLAQNTSLSNLTCLNPKIHVYWKAGFNPAQYIYPNSDPATLGTVSFYVREDHKLFINGGLLGNVTSEDTDHFDDTVIIHELGHHIEDVCGKMDSPGGIHYGFYRIDPRLSWSEGWGNFFGVHMNNKNMEQINPEVISQLPDHWSYYLDTSGYSEGANNNGDNLILLNLTKSGTSPEAVNTSNGLRYYDKVNSSSYPGEGHFREVSISRSLFKGTNTCSSGCTNDDNFSYYWKAFENDPSGIGMGKSSFAFRSSVSFFSKLTAAFSGSMPASLDTILNSNEAQQRNTSSDYISSGFLNWPAYGIKLINNGSTPCSNPLKLQPRSDTANFSNNLSDQRYSNHFFNIDLTQLASVTSITLTATKIAGSNVDIDLILYNEDYKFTEDCNTFDSSGSCSQFQKMAASDMAKYDRSLATTTSTNFSKIIQSLNSLNSSNHYLLNVRAYTANQNILNTTEYSYTLTDQTGAYLCPASTF